MLIHSSIPPNESSSYHHRHRSRGRRRWIHPQDAKTGRPGVRARSIGPKRRIAVYTHYASAPFDQLRANAANPAADRAVTGAHTGAPKDPAAGLVTPGARADAHANASASAANPTASRASPGNG